MTGENKQKRLQRLADTASNEEPHYVAASRPKGLGAGQLRDFLCYYCEKRQSVYGPKVDENGVGWLPNCMYPDCEDRANYCANIQRAAKCKTY